MCIGLGGGFWILMKRTDQDEIHVRFPDNIRTGFFFIITNCALIILVGTVIGKGVIGRGYGYVACSLYVVYVLASLAV
jgi:Ca2+/Na+ antiporter